MEFIGKFIRTFINKISSMDGFDIMFAVFMTFIHTVVLVLIGVLFMVIVKECGIIGIITILIFIALFINFIIKM